MTTAPMIIGIDLGTNWFHLIGLDERGGTVLRRKMKRTQRAAFAVTRPNVLSRPRRVLGRSTGGGFSRRRAMR